MVNIELAYELADEYTAKTKCYTVVKIERWNFNHDDASQPKIEYVFLGQDVTPKGFKSIKELVEHIKTLLAKVDGPKN